MSCFTQNDHSVSFTSPCEVGMIGIPAAPDAKSRACLSRNSVPQKVTYYRVCNPTPHLTVRARLINHLQLARRRRQRCSHTSGIVVYRLKPEENKNSGRVGWQRTVRGECTVRKNTNFNYLGSIDRTVNNYLVTMETNNFKYVYRVKI